MYQSVTSYGLLLKMGLLLSHTSTVSEYHGQQSCQYKFRLDEDTEPSFCMVYLEAIGNMQHNLTFFNGQISRRQHDNEFKKSYDNTISEQMVDKICATMKSVGAIISGGALRGTVFRVGPKYVMTALHVVTSITNPRSQNSIADNDWSKLDDPTVYITFAGSVMDLRSPIFYVKGDMIYMDPNLDIAILELKSTNDLPPSLKLSKDMGQVNYVNIMGFGHPTDSRKKLDPNCEVVHINQVKANIDQYFNINSIVLKQIGLLPDNMKGQYSELHDRDKFACHTYFEHGGSGAPAIVDDEVTGMLVKGIPYFHYNLRGTPNFTTTGIDNLPQNLMFELCIKTEHIIKRMRLTHPQLAAHLFG